MDRKEAKALIIRSYLTALVLTLTLMLIAGCAGTNPSLSRHPSRKTVPKIDDRAMYAAGEPIENEREYLPPPGPNCKHYEFSQLVSASKEVGFPVIVPENVMGGRFLKAVVGRGALGTPEITVSYSCGISISMCRVNESIDYEGHTAYYKELQKKTGMDPPPGVKSPYAINVGGVSVGVWPWPYKDNIPWKIEWCPGTILHKLMQDDAKYPLDKLLSIKESLTQSIGKKL